MKRVARGTANRRGEAGFTIIEVLVAMGILLFGMSAILGLLTFGAALSKTAHLRTASAAAAAAVVADLEETLFPMVDGEAGEPKPIQNRPVRGLEDILYSATARPNPDSPLEYRVDVEMTWKSAGVQRENRFTTILLREISFGERMRNIAVPGAASAASAASEAKRSETKTGAPKASAPSEAKPKE